MAHGVEVGRIFHHAYKSCSLRNVEISGVFIEINFSGRLDADGVIKEIKLVEIHFQNLFLRIKALEFYCYHPFDRFLYSPR